MVDSIRAGNFVSFGQQAMAAASSMGGLTAAMRTATGAAGGLGAAMSASLGPIGLIISAIAAVGAVTVSAVKSASEFENHLDGLQSLTGLDDSAMRDIADAAVDMSKNFRSSAGEIVDSMKLIGSQAPELLKDKDALMEVTEAANVLAEAA